MTYIPYSEKNLIGGTFPFRMETATIASGQGELSKGSVLGRVTASGEYKLSAAAAEDGSQTPEAILGHDVDTTSGAVTGNIIVSGDILDGALVFGEGHTVDTVAYPLRQNNIYLTKEVISNE